MVNDSGLNSLQALLQRLRDVAARLTLKSANAQDQADYVAAVQRTESLVLAMSDDEWKAAASCGAVNSIVEFAVGSVLRDPLAWVAVQSWVSAIHTLLVRTKPSVNVSEHIPQLWDGVKRLVRERNSNDGVLAAALTLLRVIFSRHPMALDSVQSHHLPHPVKTTGLAPRVAALELLPYLVIWQHQQQEREQRQRNGNRALHQPILTAAWLDYLRKALFCTVPTLREKAVEAICMLLEGGVALEVTQITVLVDTIMRFAEGDGGGDMPPRLRDNVGTAIGWLLVAAQRDAEWTHFAGTNAQVSARITSSIFQPDKMTHTMQEILSVAVGKQLLMLATISLQAMDDAVARVFELLYPVGDDDRSYMPHIVARAVKRWASRMGSDALRGALVTSLARFLGPSCAKTATHTALLCLARVVCTTVASAEFATTLWAQLLLVPMRHPSLAQATSEVLACVAQQSEVCGRVLLRELYTASGDMDAHQFMGPTAALYAKVLLAMPDTFLQQPSVLETLFALVACLSIDVPPPNIGGVFLRRVDYFNRLALLLLSHQRERLSPAIVANIRTSVRVFLSLLVGNPSSAPIYTHAACSACALLQELGTGDLELKLVLALLETMDVTSESVLSPVRAAAYALLRRVSWSNSLDTFGKGGLLLQALADVEKAIRDGVPCMASNGDEEGGGMLLSSLPGAAVECLDSRQRLLPTNAQEGQADLARRAVQFIVSSCAGTGEESEAKNTCLQPVLDRLREWRVAAVGDRAVTAWNVMYCLDGMFSHCDSLAAAEADEWFTFVSTNWLSCGVWAVHFAAARLLALLAVRTGRRDDFTSAAVKECNADGHHLGGIILALGEMHGSGNHHDKSVTAAMAASFVARVLKQRGLCVDGEAATVILAAALVAMIRMAPQHPELVMSTVRTALLPQLLLPATGALPPPLVLVLVFELLSHILLYMHLPYDTSLVVSVRGVTMYFAAAAAAAAIASTKVTSMKATARSVTVGTCFAMSDRTVSLILKRMRYIVERLAQAEQGDSAFVAAAPQILDLAVLKEYVLLLLLGGDVGCISDMVSQEAAALLGPLCSVVRPEESAVLLVAVAAMIDAAASQETRNAWASMARTILRSCGPQQLGMCLQQMELIMRGRPVRRCVGMGGEDTISERDDLAPGSHRAGGERCRSPLSAEEVATAAETTTATAIKGEDVTGTCSAAGVEVASEAASKVVVLTLLTEMLQQQHSDIYIRPDDGNFLHHHLRLILSSAALVEVVPSLVRPAVSALQAVVDIYGGRCVGGALTPFLHPWRVVLANSVQSVVQHSIFSSGPACVLAESFLVCGVADDSSVRRVVESLAKLLLALEGCEAESSAIGHGGCGRVVLALSTCRARAVEVQWRQAAKCALEAISSPSGQAAAALLCNQLTTSLALAHGFEPAHDMVPTPLDGCTCATPTSVISVLHDICSTVPALGPTVRHAAGCLLCLLLCMPHVPFGLMRDTVPLLSPTHQEIIMDVALGLLLRGSEDMLSEGEALHVLDIAATAAATVSVGGSRTEQVESFLHAMMDRNCHCMRFTAGGLRLALHSSCRLECVTRVLRQLNVDVLVASNEPMEALALRLQQQFSEEERLFMAISSPCAFLLMQRLSNLSNNSSNGSSDDDHHHHHHLSFLLLQLLAKPNVVKNVLACLAEALARAVGPLLLLQHVFPWLHQSLLACGAVLSLCVSARDPELQRRWSPCVEHVLLSSIHAETMQHEGQKSRVLERVTFFIRGVLLLLLLFTPTACASEEVRSRYPGVCTALIQQLVHHHSNELKVAIQSLRKEEALSLRGLMLLLGSGSQQQQQQQQQQQRNHSAEVAGARRESSATTVPHRLSVNVALYTSS